MPPFEPESSHRAFLSPISFWRVEILAYENRTFIVINWRDRTLDWQFSVVTNDGHEDHVARAFATSDLDGIVACEKEKSSANLVPWRANVCRMFLRFLIQIERLVCAPKIQEELRDADFKRVVSKQVGNWNWKVNSRGMFWFRAFWIWWANLKKCPRESHFQSTQYSKQLFWKLPTATHLSVPSNVLETELRCWRVSCCVTHIVVDPAPRARLEPDVLPPLYLVTNCCQTWNAKVMTFKFESKSCLLLPLAEILASHLTPWHGTASRIMGKETPVERKNLTVTTNLKLHWAPVAMQRYGGVGPTEHAAAAHAAWSTWVGHQVSKICSGPAVLGYPVHYSLLFKLYSSRK